MEQRRLSWRIQRKTKINKKKLPAKKVDGSDLEMEKCKRKHNMFTFHNKVREIARFFDKQAANILVDSAGEIIVHQRDMQGI